MTIKSQMRHEAKEFIGFATATTQLLFEGVTAEKGVGQMVAPVESWLEDHPSFQEQWEICGKRYVVFFAYMVALTEPVYGEGRFRAIINKGLIYFPTVSENQIRLLFPIVPKKQKNKTPSKKVKK